MAVLCWLPSPLLFSPSLSIFFLHRHPPRCHPFLPIFLYCSAAFVAGSAIVVGADATLLAIASFLLCNRRRCFCCCHCCCFCCHSIFSYTVVLLLHLLFADLFRQPAVPSPLSFCWQCHRHCCWQVVLLPSAWFSAVGAVFCRWRGLLPLAWFCCCRGGFAAVGVNRVIFALLPSTLFLLPSPLLFLLPLSLFFLTLLSFCSNLLFTDLLRQPAVPSPLLLALMPPLFCCRQHGFAAVSMVLLPSACFAAVGVVCCCWRGLLQLAWFCYHGGGFAAVGVVLLLSVWFCCCRCGFAAVGVVLLPSALVLLLSALVLQLLHL